MTEAKPSMGNSQPLDSADVTSQPEPSDERSPSRVASGTKVSPTHEADTATSDDAKDHNTEQETKTEEEEVVDEDEDEDEEDEDEDEDEGDSDDEDDEDDDDDEDEEEDDEPKLKYARLTQHLGPVYRNGDSTSAFLVAGDKMIVGTHKGNIHVIQLPTFESLIAYHAHDASVTSISISPNPPPALPPTLKPEAVARAMAQTPSRPSSTHIETSPRQARKAPQLPQVPNLPSNNIHIASSSMDGLVRVQSLVDLKDCQLRNFARPVQAVAISPDYKNDKTYVSGGRAGNLVLTVGAPQGRSTSTTVGTAAAAASGWLGSMGLGTNTGKDTVLHSGEGPISTIKWSLSGKYVVWLNEHGIKIMRTKLHLESGDPEDAWKRIGHVDRPQSNEWEEMAGFWAGRAEWIDDQAISGDDADERLQTGSLSQATARLARQEKAKALDKSTERLIVGWGGTIWIIHVHAGNENITRAEDQKRLVARAEIAKILRMDCIISGISLYTQNLLLVLAYCNPEEEKEDDEEQEDADKAQRTGSVRGHKASPSITSSGSGPTGGRKHRQNAIQPELRLIDLVSQVEVDKGSLPVSNYQSLSSNDYHLGVLPASKAASVAASRGALEALAGFGNEMWNVAINPISLFSSGASIRSRNSNDGTSRSQAGGNARDVRVGLNSSFQAIHPNLVKPGSKLFVHSPYDCILATQRDLSDHLTWLLEREKYQEAWELVDENPEVLAGSDKFESIAPAPDRTSTVEDLFEDTSSVAGLQREQDSPIKKEKQRIGELWIQELLDDGNWAKAAEVISMVIRTSDGWEKWVYTFASAKRFDEIVKYIPTEPMRPPIPGTIYEIVLGHYLRTDKPRFKELLDRWDLELFNVQAISTALENQLKFRDVREDSIEDGEKGRDWRIVVESLARLHEANGKHRDALKCYIKLQDADSAMRLIRDNHLADAVVDDVASFIALRVPDAGPARRSREELADLTSEAITLLVDETTRGLIHPETVVSQLEEKNLDLYLYFYFSRLWREYREKPVDETVSLIDEFPDLVVRIFVSHDRELLMDFLKISTSYAFEKAVQECEAANYIPELVYLYSKTGQMKRALYLIIDRLADVSQAIAFAKEQDDPDLWEDLLEYSMDKPRFIRGLLEEVGTSINPITLVRRIPGGLEIPGLREGLKHIMKEHEIQYSISSGVARVLRSEVLAAQNQLRNGQRKGVKFDVVLRSPHHVDVAVQDAPKTAIAAANTFSPAATPRTQDSGTPVSVSHAVNSAEENSKTGQPATRGVKEVQPGHCANCHEPFTEWEVETLVGFACGHVFHLSHLLEVLYPGQEVDAAMAEANDTGRPQGGRFVGTKVTHARLLRDRVERGCAVCQHKMEIVQGTRT